MNQSNMIHILLIICTLFTFSVTRVQGFCVADLNKGVQTPSGYSCKNDTDVSVDDFVYSGLRTPGNISNKTKAAVKGAFVTEIPAMNGLGMYISRVDLARGGSVHMRAQLHLSKILMVTKGTIKAGVMSSAKKVYVKTLKKDDIMVIPPGVEHFMENIDDVTSVEQLRGVGRVLGSITSGVMEFAGSASSAIAAGVNGLTDVIAGTGEITE